MLDGSRRRCVSNESQSLGSPAPKSAPPRRHAPPWHHPCCPLFSVGSALTLTQATASQRPRLLQPCLAYRGFDSQRPAGLVVKGECFRGICLLLAVCTRAYCLSSPERQLPLCTLGGLAVALPYRVAGGILFLRTEQDMVLLSTKSMFPAIFLCISDSFHFPVGFCL